jgi:uncharacterized RDD family membrane protein YckC
MAVNPYAELATRRQRLAANALDAFILALIILPAAFVVPAIDGFGVLVASSMLVLASVFVASTNLWLLASHGATIGKHVMRIRATRCDGSRASIWRLVFLRGLPLGLLALLPYLNLLVPASLLLIFRDERRCLHDYLADTIVIKA